MTENDKQEQNKTEFMTRKQSLKQTNIYLSIKDYIEVTHNDMWTC